MKVSFKSGLRAAFVASVALGVMAQSCYARSVPTWGWVRQAAAQHGQKYGFNKQNPTKIQNGVILRSFVWASNVEARYRVAQHLPVPLSSVPVKTRCGDSPERPEGRGKILLRQGEVSFTPAAEAGECVEYEMEYSGVWYRVYGTKAQPLYGFLVAQANIEIWENGYMTPCVFPWYSLSRNPNCGNGARGRVPGQIEWGIRVKAVTQKIEQKLTAKVDVDVKNNVTVDEIVSVATKVVNHVDVKVYMPRQKSQPVQYVRESRIYGVPGVQRAGNSVIVGNTSNNQMYFRGAQRQDNSIHINNGSSSNSGAYNGGNTMNGGNTNVNTNVRAEGGSANATNNNRNDINNRNDNRNANTNNNRNDANANASADAEANANANADSNSSSNQTQNNRPENGNPGTPDNPGGGGGETENNRPENGTPGTGNNADGPTQPGNGPQVDLNRQSSSSARKK